jgi:hypothetical protein
MTLNDDELRIISLSSGVWMRMLEERSKRILDRIHGEFRNGKTDHLAALAELACVRDQIHEITQALKQLEAKRSTQ